MIFASERNFPAINFILETLNIYRIENYDMMLRRWAIKGNICPSVYNEIIVILKKVIIKRYLDSFYDIYEADIEETENYLLVFLYNNRRKTRWGFSEQSWKDVSTFVKKCLKNRFSEFERVEEVQAWEKFKWKTSQSIGIRWLPDSFLQPKSLVVKK